MNRLVIFGDSNSYGTGLDDPSTESYGYHLSNLTNREYINKAIPGSSCNRILFEILNFQFKPNDVAIVGWTYFCRETLYYNDGPCNMGAWINDKNTRNRAWLEEIYDVNNLSVKSYLDIHHATCYLNQINVPNIQWCPEEDSECLQVKKEFAWARNIQMSFDIIRETPHVDLTICTHPGPKSHKLVAEYIFEHFKDMF